MLSRQLVENRNQGDAPACGRPDRSRSLPPGAKGSPIATSPDALTGRRIQPVVQKQIDPLPV